MNAVPAWLPRSTLVSSLIEGGLVDRDDHHAFAHQLAKDADHPLALLVKHVVVVAKAGAVEALVLQP